MKPVYTLMISLCISMAVLTTQDCFAQCNCWTGLAATPITTSFSLPSSNLPSADLVFNQMDPSVGDLSCMTFNYNISAQSIIGARNYASSTALLPITNPIYSPTGRLEYTFNLNLTANLAGPSISVNKNYNSTLGPDSLGAFGQPDDTITYGPINEFSNLSGSKNFAGSGAYLGTGTIDFSYSFSGGLTTDEGGTNYSQKILTNYWGISHWYTTTAPLNPLRPG